MFRIAALNADSSGSDGENAEDDVRGNAGPSREVLESTAHSAHSIAIVLLSRGDQTKAEENFVAVLNNPYVANVRLL